MLALKILTDEVDSDPILNFQKYAESIANIVKSSDPKFSIGIYGEWGTGKTTLMKLVKDKLDAYVKKEVFSWDDIKIGDNSKKLKRFLIENYGVNWIEDSEIEADRDNKTLRISGGEINKVIDNRGSFESNYPHSLSIHLNDKKNIATLVIDNEPVRNFKVVSELNNSVSIHLQESEILTVWFNAWRYEREEQFALVALMKTIAFAMGNLPQYKEIRKIFLRGLQIIGKDVLRHFALEYAMTEGGVKEFEENLLPKMELLSKVDKDTIYFDGLNKIEEEMKKVSKTNRIVVFIDDLDRCNSEKALEVFESTKVFLDIEGFIFIIGLSHETLSKLISKSEQYEKVGIKGEDYIRKIIQVYINIPKWKSGDIKSLVGRLSEKLDDTHKKIFVDQKNSELLEIAVALNPREVKRLINRFIMAHSVNPSIDATEFLVGQALESRWSEFYRAIDTNSEFRAEVSGYAHMRTLDDIETALQGRKDKSEKPSEVESMLFKISPELWHFLIKYNEIVGTIMGDWESYKDKHRASAEPTRAESAWTRYYNLLLLYVRSSSPKREVISQIERLKSQLIEEYQKGSVPSVQFNSIANLISSILTRLGESHANDERPIPKAAQDELLGQMEVNKRGVE